MTTEEKRTTRSGESCEREEDEAKTGHELFKFDYRDPTLYHAVINSGLLTPAQEFEAVKALLNMKRSESSPVSVAVS